MDQLDEPLGKVATTDTFITHDEYVIMPSTFCGISDDLGIFMLYLQDPPPSSMDWFEGVFPAGWGEFFLRLTDQVSLKMFPQIKSETGKTGLETMVISL